MRKRAKLLKRVSQGGGGSKIVSMETEHVVTAPEGSSTAKVDMPDSGILLFTVASKLIYGIGLMTPTAVHDGRASAVRDARQRVLRAAYAVHPERFVRKPPQPPMLPHAVWINPPKAQAASQDRAGAMISTADDQRGNGAALNVEVLGVVPETTEGLRHPVTTPTYEVLH